MYTAEYIGYPTNKSHEPDGPVQQTQIQRPRMTHRSKAETLVIHVPPQQHPLTSIRRSCHMYMFHITWLFCGLYGIFAGYPGLFGGIYRSLLQKLRHLSLTCRRSSTHSLPFADPATYACFISHGSFVDYIAFLQDIQGSVAKAENLLIHKPPQQHPLTFIHRSCHIYVFRITGLF